MTDIAKYLPNYLCFGLWLRDLVFYGYHIWFVESISDACKCT